MFDVCEFVRSKFTYLEQKKFNVKKFKEISQFGRLTTKLLTTTPQVKDIEEPKNIKES